jgi:hypothetical protein
LRPFVIGSLEGVLRRHWQLSALVEDLDRVFSPTLLIFLGSEVAVVVSLIGYLICESEIEAPLGLFVTNSTADTVTYFIYGFGAVAMLLMRISVAGLLHHQVNIRHRRTSPQ